MAKGARQASRNKKRERLRRGAAVIIALASNISAPLVPPFWGVSLAVVGVIFWLYSLAPIESWIKTHIRTNTTSSIIYAILILGVISIPFWEGFKAWKKWTQPPPVAAVSNHCPPATGICFNGNAGEVHDIKSFGSPNGIVVNGDSNKLHDATSVFDINEYAKSPQKIEGLIVALHLEHEKKWNDLPATQRMALQQRADYLEKSIRNVEGDPDTVGPLLTELWVLQ